MSPITSTRLKLIGLFIVSNILLFAREGFLVSGTIAGAVIVLLVARKLFRPFTRWIKGLIPVFTVIVLLQTFLTNGFGYTPEGLMLGLYSVVRIFALTSIVFLLINTTRLSLIARSLSFLPFHIGFILTVAVSMIESLQKEAVQITTAQRARGHRAGWNPIRTYLPVLLPLFARSITRAEKLAVAVQSRGLRVT